MGSFIFFIFYFLIIATTLICLYLYIIKSWSVTFIVVTLLLNHISSHVIHLFFIYYFLYLNFSSPYFPKKKKKILPSISSQTYYYTSSNLSLSFLPLYLLLLYRYTSFLFFYILTLLLPIQSIFSPTKLWVLSLSLDEFLFFLITLVCTQNMVPGFNLYLGSQFICVVAFGFPIIDGPILGDPNTLLFP